MIRNKEYLKSKYETGDVPTEENYSDLIDSCYNGSSGSNIDIPEINLYTKEYIDGAIPRRSEVLMGYWSQNDTSFLSYNPEVWLYRYKNNKKVLEGGELVKHKKIIHTPHLNGINYPSSSFYAGSFFSPVSEINTTGVHTEFSIGLSGNTAFNISVDPYDWFYMLGAASYKLNDNLPLVDAGYELRVFGRPKGNNSFLFRMAITIEDPNGGQQRLVGPISDEIALRIENNRFVYRRNLSSLSNLRFQM